MTMPNLRIRSNGRAYWIAQDIGQTSSGATRWETCTGNFATRAEARVELDRIVTRPSNA